MLVTLSALQSVRVHTECTAACPLFHLVRSVFAHSGVLKAVHIAHLVFCSPSVFFKYHNLYVFRTDCAAVCPSFTPCVFQITELTAVCTCFTLTVLQSVRVSHRVYFKLRSLLQSVRVPRLVYTTVYVFQTARGMAGP